MSKITCPNCKHSARAGYCSASGTFYCECSRCTRRIKGHDTKDAAIRAFGGIVEPPVIKQRYTEAERMDNFLIDVLPRPLHEQIRNQLAKRVAPELVMRHAKASISAYVASKRQLAVMSLGVEALLFRLIESHERRALGAR